MNLKITLVAIASIFTTFEYAQAAQRLQQFEMQNPGIHCEVGTASRSAGVRYIWLLGDFPQALKNIGIPTRVTSEPITFDYTSDCSKLSPAPDVLQGQRELYVQRLESGGKCSTIVIEEITMNIGKNNPTPHTKTAWPILGTDLSAYTKENCALTEADFEKALDDAL